MTPETKSHLMELQSMVQTFIDHYSESLSDDAKSKIGVIQNKVINMNNME